MTILYIYTAAAVKLVSDDGVCPEATSELMFTCQVTFDMASPGRLQWRVEFNNTLNEHYVTQNFISSDTIGQIQVNRDIFYFNLTSSSSSGLNSTMVINVTSANNRQSINGAIVSCSLGNDSQYQIIVVSNLTETGNKSVSTAHNNTTVLLTFFRFL